MLLVVSPSVVVGRAIKQVGDLLLGKGAVHLLEPQTSPTSATPSPSPALDLSRFDRLLFFLGSGRTVAGSGRSSYVLEFLDLAARVPTHLPPISFLTTGRETSAAARWVTSKCLRLENQASGQPVASTSVDVRQCAAWLCSRGREPRRDSLPNVFRHAAALLKVPVQGRTLNDSEVIHVLDRLAKVDPDLQPDPAARDAARREFFHDAQYEPERQIQPQVVLDLIVESMDYLKTQQLAHRQRFNIVWIENRPGIVAEDLKASLRFFPNYALYLFKVKGGDADDGQDFQRLADEAASGRLEEFDDLVPLVNAEGTSLKLENVDLVVLDAYLGEKHRHIDPADLTRALLTHYPQVPLFMLSASEDDHLVERCLTAGADYFLNKRFAALLPYYIHALQNKFGRLLWTAFTSRRYARNLLGNVRYWSHHREFLWYGDKCYHMINHAYEHMLDNWRATNEILPFVLDRWELPEDSLYAFCMAMWLHDIGHKGNSRHSEPYVVRDRHGIISGELVLASPGLFGLIESNGRYDDSYSGAAFAKGEDGPSVVQELAGRPQPRVSNAELTAILAIYHKSNGPLTAQDVSKMQGDGKYIPDEYFETDDTVLSLEDVLRRRRVPEAALVLKLTSLFRLIDGLDIHKTRVGDHSEKSLKARVIEQDKHYYFGRLKALAEHVVLAWGGTGSPYAGQIRQQLVDGPIAAIESRKFTMNMGSQRNWLARAHLQNEYALLLNYAAFLAVQDGHFDLHACVDEIVVEPGRTGTWAEGMLELRYRLNRSIDWLDAREVREMRVDPMSILAKLFGNPLANQLPYPVDELRGGSQYLGDILNLDRGLLLSLEVPEIPAKRARRVEQEYELVADPRGGFPPNRIRYIRRLVGAGGTVTFDKLPTLPSGVPHARTTT